MDCYRNGRYIYSATSFISGCLSTKSLARFTHRYISSDIFKVMVKMKIHFDGFFSRSVNTSIEKFVNHIMVYNCKVYNHINFSTRVTD